MLQAKQGACAGGGGGWLDGWMDAWMDSYVSASGGWTLGSLLDFPFNKRHKAAPDMQHINKVSSVPSGLRS